MDRKSIDGKSQYSSSSKSFHGFDIQCKAADKKVDQNSEKMSDAGKCKGSIAKSRSSNKSKREIEMRKILIDQEKQKLELLKLQVQKQEIDVKIKMTALELDVKQIMLEDISCYSSCEEKQEDEKFKEESVKKWVENVDPKFDRDEKVEEHGNLSIMQNESKNENDLTKLCSVIEKAINNAANTNNNYEGNLIRRQILDKDLPYFDGNPETWPLFISQYNRKIELCNYTDDEKMVKLQKCLKGEALEMVKGMMLHPKNVNLIIQTLEMRFGRPEYVIEALTNKLQEFPAVKEGDFDNLIKFSCQINNFVATLEQLEAKNHMNNPFILKQLLYKVPVNLRLQWGQIVKDKEKNGVTIEDFAKWCNNIASAACCIHNPKIKTTYVPRKYPVKHENVMHVTDSDKKTTKCYYCKKAYHEVSKCAEVLNDNVDDRWKKIVQAKACFCCLKNNHRKNECKSKKQCSTNGCKKRHHYLLHKEYTRTINQPLTPEQNLPENDPSLEASNSQHLIVNTINSNLAVLLRIVKVKLYGNNGVFEAYALLDEGSTVTLIDARLANKIGVRGTENPFCMKWANGVVLNNEESEMFDIKISGTHENAKIMNLKSVRTMKELNLPSQTIIVENLKDKHLQGLPISDMINAKPTLLIGQDNIHLTVARKIYQGPRNRPIATKTHLGWLIHGNDDRNNYTHGLVLHICNHEYEDCLDQLVKNTFSTENFGVTVTNKLINQQESRALSILEKTTVKLDTENRYETGLLWKRENIVLPKSRQQAMNRLLCVERKMSKDPTYHEKYCQKIADYENKKYIRKLKPEETTIRHPRTWYLPHFGIINPNKPDKFRLVFDAAARSNGTSLNENLLKGPDFLTSLPGVLMRFRRWEFAFCGDIAEMFHQVKIQKEDRHSQRFLWRDGDLNQEVHEYEMQVMIFGATCSPCAAQYVKNLNAEQSVKYSHLANDVKENFYVDDYLDSCTTEYEAIKKVDEIINLHHEGGFNIVGWISNSEELTERFGNSKNSQKDLSKVVTNRVLGVWWDVKMDSFLFKLTLRNLPEEVIKGIEHPTKRQALRLIMSVFDPLGFLTCLVVRARIILQKIWRTGIGWDDFIPASIFSNWKTWLMDLQRIEELKITRCYSLKLASCESLEAHVFCDASEEAFAAVVYIRIISAADIQVAFVTSRARVSPLKPLSIPRLELQAAVMGSRLLKTVKQEIKLKIDKSYLWSDSKTVLHWIRGDGRNYKQFVSHRVGEIQELTSNDCWMYVPTKLNVADQATRLETEFELSSDSIWNNGPSFLKMQKEYWPEQINFISDINDSEEKDSGMFIGVICQSEKLHLINFERFSKWLRLVRTTAWIFRMRNNLLNLIKENYTRISQELSYEEIQKGEEMCIQKSQEESFETEIMEMKRSGKVKISSRLFQLSPFLDKNGIIRMQSRIENADIDESVKTPIILDPKNRFTRLTIQYYHERNYHSGIETVHNNLRQKFWILKGRTAVKNIFKNCQLCKVKKSKPNVPKMGQLPLCRLDSNVKPFTHTGIDYFGPLYVTVGRHKEKRWGVIFTCMTIRAVHLEIAHSLTADGTIMAVRRMMSRRGAIQHLYSDNGTNFRAASEEINLFKEQAIKNDNLKQDLTTRQIQWHFNPPGTPHMGGAWERLIGSVKRVLQNVLKEEAPKDEVLLTLMIEAENIVNNRPITHISMDPNDPESLTPNHFLIGSVLSPQEKFENVNFKALWKKSQQLTDLFWTKWIKDYLPNLTKRGKWTKDSTPVRIGDIVVIIDQNLPRNSWPLGKISKLYPGKDKIIRVVDVQTKNGTFRRPVSRLCRIDG